MSESATHRLAMAWDLHERPKHDLLFELARGYIHAATVIFEEQQGAENYTFYNLLPGHFALAHSVELFLKAAISLRGKRIPNTHNLEYLHSQYCKLFPDEKLAFRCRISELISWDRRWDRPSCRRYGNYSQYARYPFDKKGKVWLPNEHIIIEFTLDRIREFSEDFERLEPALREAIQTDTTST